jgi:hypothetical protein
VWRLYPLGAEGLADAAVGRAASAATAAIDVIVGSLFMAPRKPVCRPMV